MKMKKLLLSFYFIFVFCWSLEARDLVDIPTAEVIDYSSFEMSFRFYSQGGILSRLNFGVVRNMNLGVYIDVERIIGSQDIGWDDLDVPRLYLKFRLYPGSMQMPALALGYDAQGYRNYKDDSREKARGFYLVLSKELFLPGLQFHLGGNVSITEEDNKFFGFLGGEYKLSDRVLIFTEYDKLRGFDSGRWNAGVLYKISENITADFCLRDIVENTIDCERILRINYRGIF